MVRQRPIIQNQNNYKSKTRINNEYFNRKNKTKLLGDAKDAKYSVFGDSVPRSQGSYREAKVLNVLEFYDFIRVPLNVLEFVLNVLECPWILLLLAKKWKYLLGLFIPASNVRGKRQYYHVRGETVLVIIGLCTDLIRPFFAWKSAESSPKCSRLSSRVFCTNPTRSINGNAIVALGWADFSRRCLRVVDGLQWRSVVRNLRLLPRLLLSRLLHDSSRWLLRPIRLADGLNPCMDRAGSPGSIRRSRFVGQNVVVFRPATATYDYRRGRQGALVTTQRTPSSHSIT